MKKTIFSDFRKKNRKKCVKKKKFKISKTGKGKNKVNALAAIWRDGRLYIELFTDNMDSGFYWEYLKEI